MSLQSVFFTEFQVKLLAMSCLCPPRAATTGSAAAALKERAIIILTLRGFRVSSAYAEVGFPTLGMTELDRQEGIATQMVTEIGRTYSR